MKTILVPLDFSSASERVVDAAVELAHAFNGSVVLLNVVWVPPSILDTEGETEQMKEFAAELELNAAERLRDFLPAFEAKSVFARVRCVSGRPGAMIVEQAKKLSADYIVIGSHGHTAFYDLILGSTTSAVVKRSSCPVIVVPLRGRSLKKESKVVQGAHR